MADSRLTRRYTKQGRKQFYWSLIGIVVVIFAALNFGPILIASLGNIIDTFTGKASENSEIIADSELKAPILDPLPVATSEDRIDITGTSFYNEGVVELHVNGTKLQSERLSGTQEFELKNVSLKQGENLLKVRAVNGNNIGEFSEEYKISYIKEPPKLEISSPQDKQVFAGADREITVRGTTEEGNTITVNDFIAIVNSSGEFNYNLRLKEGENTIKVIAENQAGVTSEKEVIVSYSP